MNTHHLSPFVMVSIPSVQNTDPHAIINSNISVINVLREAGLPPEQIAPDALRSYFVDYYLAQVENGGFSQFVYNSRWSDEVIALVREGLRSMGALQHAAVFEEGAALVADLGAERLSEYFSSKFFGENTTRDELNTINKRFFATSEIENLTELNAAWLRSLPNLKALTIAQLEQEVARLTRGR